MECATVLYDRDCGFCRWSVDALRRWDRHGALAFEPIQSARGRSLLAPVPRSERLRSAHLVTSHGRIRSGGAAVAPVLRRLPGGAALAWAAARAPRLTDRAYRWTAARREPLGRLLGADACALEGGGDPDAAV